MTKRDKCLWYDTCVHKTATCRVRYPDEGCVLYRWFKELIMEENKNDKTRDNERD